MLRRSAPFLKRAILTLLALLATLTTACAGPADPAPPADSALRIMSYNLRYAAADDAQWRARRDPLVALIREYDPDVLGVQEADWGWMDFLPAQLDDYAYVGVGRDDGATSGEYAAIFYKTARFEVLETGDFWISETPEVPSFGWGANNRRICTWAKLRDKVSDQTFVHFNTHLDHESDAARTEGTKLLLARIGDSADPAVLTGDLNFNEGSSNYHALTEGGLRDTKYEAENSMSHGTMNWFGAVPFDVGWVIDFVMVTPDISVQRYAVPNHHRAEGKPVSDHYPVFADITLR